MLPQLIQIAEVFAKVAEGEDKFLSDTCDRGIFFMPELAYAYVCGKAVMREADRIFSGTHVNW